VDGVTAEAGDVEVRKVEETRLYEAVIGGEVVGSLAYETAGGKTSLTHSFVDPDRRNMGIGSALAEFALADVAASGARPLVYCGFVADYVDAHPRWNGAVDVSRWNLIPTWSTRPQATDAPREKPPGHGDPTASAKPAGQSQI
jgi:predicted GNAT family acetyltransferase